MAFCDRHAALFRQPVSVKLDRNAMVGRDYPVRWVGVPRRVAVLSVGGVEIVVR